MFSGQKVLVTGAAGFIGSHLVAALLARGAKVRAFVRYTSREERGWLDSLTLPSAAQMEVVAGDLKDADAVRNSIKDCRIVFHLGALIGIPYSYVHPRNYVETNIIGTTNVLAGCLDHGVDRLVTISTSEVYGTAQYVPIDERHPKVGQSPYAASKIAADMLAESYYRSFGLPVTIIRPFNTYGPRQSRRAIIPTIISQLLAGTDLKLGATAPTRDFTFVTDTVAGIIRGAEAPDAIGATVNLGTGTELAIGQLAERIAALMNVPLRLNRDDARLRPANSEVERLISNNELARRVLSWEPTITLDDGLTLTIDWFKRNRVERRAGEYIL